MKRLHKLVIKSFLGPFVLTFFIVMFLLLMQFLWRYIDDLVGKGLKFNIISDLLLYASSSLVPLALPLSVLLSSLMTFGGMGEHYELTALKSSGISLRRIMLPLVILTVFITMGAFAFSNYVLPVTNLKMKSLLYDVSHQRPELQITQGIFYNGIDNYSIRINRKDPETNMLYGIMIYDHTARKGNISVTIADSGYMQITSDRRNLLVTLWNGSSYSELEELMRSDESIFKNAYQMLNVSQLKHATDSLSTEIKQKTRSYNKALLNKIISEKMKSIKDKNRTSFDIFTSLFSL